MKSRKPRRFNPIARALRSWVFKQRVVRARKGRGCFTKHATQQS